MSDLLSPPYNGYAPFWVHANQELDAIGSGVRIVWALAKGKWVRVRDRDGFNNQRVATEVWASIPKTPAEPGQAMSAVIAGLYPNRAKGACDAKSCRV